MRDLGGLQPAMAGLPEGFRDIDLLINNAGLAPPLDTVQDSALEPALQAIETNVTGLVALTRALLPGLIARRGAIINMSSVAATYPYRGGAVYGGTKAFVRQFSLDLRADLHGTGVRVTSIEPGMIETEFTLVRNGWDKAASDALYANMNAMTAEDTADILYWVATLPPHVNVNALELMPTNQSFAGFQVAREG
jgi:serine 3-dehydrogenase